MRHGGAERRRRLILERLHHAGHVSVSAVSAETGVSEMTIRRDLRQLADEGMATLVHGGARLPPGQHQPAAFDARHSEHATAKHRIARAVSELLPDDGAIGIDAGTSALACAIALSPTFTGCIVSHSVPVLASMLAHSQIQVIGLGGDLLHDNQAMVGAAALTSLRQLRLDALVIGASAIDPRGIYVHTTLELSVKQALIDAADRVVLACDSSKERARGAVRVCGLDALHTVVTEAPLEAALTAALGAAGCELVVA